MSTFVMIAQLIAALALLVFVHELGHFVAARMFKIRVPKFYLFFNPTISLVKCKRINGKWRFKFFQKNLPDSETQIGEDGKPIVDEKGKGKQKMIDPSSLADDDWRKYPENTEYGIGWLPLGGYCQIAGMIDETQSIENLSSDPQPWEYRSKPAWQRLIVVLGGVIVNLIVGVLLFAMVIGKYEKQYLPNEAVTDGIYAYEAARNMGFQTGDKLISINGKKEVRFKDAISPKIYFGSIVQVERNGEQKNIVIGEDAYAVFKEKRGGIISSSNYYPIVIDNVLTKGAAYSAGMQKGDMVLSINDTILLSSMGALSENLRNFSNQMIFITCLRNEDTVHLALTPDSSGLIGITSLIPYQLKPYSFGQAIVYGWKDAMNSLMLNVKGIGKIVSGEEKATESLSGPIGIAQLFGREWIWEWFWYLTGLLSVILAFMNVLPIPGFDGGHAIFATIEIITRRKVPDKVLQYAQMVGMFILILLMAFVIGNDIFKLFR